MHFDILVTVILIKSYSDNLCRDDDEKDRPDDAFREMITSCRSLSNYESNTLKCALPQVILLIMLKVE